MPEQNLEPLFLQPLDPWLREQILRLSVDMLSVGLLTCTACEKVFGEYILEYKGETFRLPAGKAYAFLKYVQETTTDSFQ
ncbi:hypothetical protein [Pseudanabaena sp. FACHB-2040]|uniref:hypothetical protein n=1 Tax=Pseudanabaena sp. FACHB-2040 TaxID=2692859 RepID=UPI00168481B2|nr:hypothetical protein [Pseudanabaena sp. FACHB-2040]MBD2258314.1 hypothetical protein [Pseudanabaena sp. FACHB-2040]